MIIKLISILSIVCFQCCFSSPLSEDLKALYQLKQLSPSPEMTQDFINKSINSIYVRVNPQLDEAFRMLCKGQVMPLINEVVTDYQAIDYAFQRYRRILKAQPEENKSTSIQTFLTVLPTQFRAYYFLKLNRYIKKENLLCDDIQLWLTDSINNGELGVALHYLLTEESKEKIAETARKNMREFNRENDHDYVNISSLISAAFLASRNDTEAIRLLIRLLETRNIKSSFDRFYLILIAALSEHPTIYQKLKEIILTDKQTYWYGIDCLPQEASFSRDAAFVYSISVEGFPKTDYWDQTKDIDHKKIQDWFNSHSHFKIKCPFDQLYRTTPLERILDGMEENLEVSLKPKHQ